MNIKTISLLLASVSMVLYPLAVSASFSTKTFLSSSIDSGNGESADEAYIDEPRGMDLASSDDIYITDTANNVIERISAENGTLDTVAGTRQYGFKNGATGDVSEWNNPKGIAIRGNKLYVSDTVNDVIRTIEL